MLSSDSLSSFHSYFEHLCILAYAHVSHFIQNSPSDVNLMNLVMPGSVLGGRDSVVYKRPTLCPHETRLHWLETQCILAVNFSY